MKDLTHTKQIPPDQLLVPPPGYNDLSGMTLGGYRLVRKIAQGGMGVVYEAVQIKLARKVALKILTDQLAGRPEFLQRFEREAKAAAALNHPNIVQVYDFGEAEGRDYIAMEFIEGDNLSNYIAKTGKVPIPDALAIVEQVALALKAANEKAIVHRDIKPSNILVTRDGRVKVADMGLAKILTEDSELTMSSASIGSPHFIAPEQAGSSKNADHRVDIYSLGITLLYLVTGKFAFDGASPISIVLAHATKPLPTGAELGTELPPQLEALIHHMAERDPDKRYQTYDDLLGDLRLVKQGFQPVIAPAYQRPQSREWKMKMIAAISILAAVVLAVGALFATRFIKHPAAQQPSTNNLPPGANGPFPQWTGNFGGQPRFGQGQYPRQGFSGSGRFPMPMWPPYSPQQEGLASGGSVTNMLAAADDYATKNPTNYVFVLGRYRMILQQNLFTPQAPAIRTRIDKWTAAQNDAATQAIAQYEIKMRAALTNGGPQAAYDAWKDFPVNLRSREADSQIMNILEQTLPPGFQPAGQTAPNGQP